MNMFWRCVFAVAVLVPGKFRLKESAKKYREAQQELKEAKQELKEAEKELHVAKRGLEKARQELVRAKAQAKATEAWCDVGKEIREFFDKNPDAGFKNPQLQELIKKEIITYRELAALQPNQEKDEEYLSYWLKLLDTKEAIH